MGRTRFLCSYNGCKSCSPNMRFNIERHVWTQHVRKNVPGMDQSNYVARLHKTYVERYVVMAEDVMSNFSAPESNQEPSMQRKLLAQHTLSDSTMGADHSIRNSFGNRMGEAARDGTHLDGIEGIDRLTDVFSSAPVDSLRRHSVVGTGAELRRDLDLTGGPSRGYFADVASSSRMPRRPSDLGGSMQGSKCGGQQPGMKVLDGGHNDDSFFGSSVGPYGQPCQQGLVGLHPSKSLAGLGSIAEDSLVRSMGERAEAEGGANNVDSLLSVAVAQLSPQDQQQLYNAGAHLKMQTATRWPEFNYYLNLANAQDANNGDVWRPVHF